MVKDTICKKIAAQKKRVEDYERAVEQVKSFRVLENNWRKLLKRGKLQSVSYSRMTFCDLKDEPVDMAEIWNWMVKHSRPETKAYHSAVASMLKETVKNWSSKVEQLCA